MTTRRLSPAPNRLSGTALAALISPLTTAQAAMRLGTFDSEHYHTLACAFSIAHEIIQLVPRHRTLAEDLKPSLVALNAIFERGEPYQVAPGEADAIDEGVAIYRALLTATSGHHVRRAIARVREIAAQIDAGHA